jgi:hypothetical protein
MDGKEFIKVYLRLRPELKQGNTHVEVATEINGDVAKLNPVPNCRCWTCAGAKEIQRRQNFAVARSLKTEKAYKFDRIFQENSTQEEIYDIFQPYVDAALEGYTSTIITYGPAGGGKSYTLVGKRDNPGILPRAFDNVFRVLNELTTENPRNLVDVELSYVEFTSNGFINLLKNEGASTKEVAYKGPSLFSDNMGEENLSEVEVIDLLTHSAESMVILHSDKIELRESKELGVFLSGPKLRFPVKTSAQAIGMLKWADNNRLKSFTTADEAKNRGHLIITLYTDSKVGSEIRLGRIHFVNLAGGEKIPAATTPPPTGLNTMLPPSNTKDSNDQNVLFINKSLLAFGK